MCRCTHECFRQSNNTPSVPINSIQFPLWDVPSFLYIPKIATFYNIKHYYTHYILPLSPFYNNKNTITPTTLLHYLKSIIKKYVGPTTLPTFHLTLLISYTFSWSPCPIPMYIIHWDGGSICVCINRTRVDLFYSIFSRYQVKLIRGFESSSNISNFCRLKF